MNFAKWAVRVLETGEEREPITPLETLFGLVELSGVAWLVVLS